MSTRRHESHRANHLLGAIAPADLKLLRPHLEVAECERGTVVVDAGKRITHVLFAQSAVICLIAVTPKSGAAEVATIGAEPTELPSSLFGAAVVAERLGFYGVADRTSGPPPSMASNWPLIVPPRAISISQ